MSKEAFTYRTLQTTVNLVYRVSTKKQPPRSPLKYLILW